jgi:putative phage-type endonuclease
MKALDTLPADGSDATGAVSTPARVRATWPCITTAAEILPAGAVDTDFGSWLEVRRGGLGGSEIAAVLGLHPFHSPYQVWLDKTGRTRPIRDQFIMRRGRYYEPAIAQWFADETRLGVKTTGTWASLDAPWKRCNPDRFTSDGYGLEIKVPASEWAAQWKDGPALYAVVQAIWCAHVLGLRRWYLAADVNQGRGAELPVWVVDVEEWAERLAYWVEIAEWWWYRYVEGDTPPPVDASEATAEALSWAFRRPNGGEELGHMVRVPGLRPKVTRRAELKAVIKEAEGELRGVESWIKAALEHDEVGCDDDEIPIIAWRPVGTDKEDPTLPAHRAMREIKPPKARKRAASKKATTTP